MHLLLIRHAQAGEHDPAVWPDDTLRPLTDRGRKIHRAVSRRMRRRGLVPERILSSPWARAWETAEITAEVSCRGRVVPEECPALAAPPDDLMPLADAIGPQGAASSIALVGHEPWLSQLAALLLTGETEKLTIDFPKSGVLGVELATLAPGQGALRFLLRPRQAY
jgi:phosphohistidine phosphatase